MTHRSSILCASLAAAACLIPAARSHAVNLVVNGSFEQPFATVGQFASIPGWTKTCGTSIELQSVAGTGLAAFDGTQWWETDGVDNTCLSQSFPSAPNTVYQLSFAHSARPGVADNAVTVFWNGSPLVTVNANGVGQTGTAWQQGIYTLVSNSNTATLEIRATGSQNQLGGFIDGVVLERLDCRPRCPGDADGDGVVTFADITSVLTNFGVRCP